MLNSDVDKVRSNCSLTSSIDLFQFDSVSQGKSVLVQVAHALAVAEESLQFEHRDLHWGNVLVRPTKQEEIAFRVLGKTLTVPTMGVQASVIDFTMSRLTKGKLPCFLASFLYSLEKYFETWKKLMAVTIEVKLWRNIRLLIVLHDICSFFSFNYA